MLTRRRVTTGSAVAGALVVLAVAPATPAWADGNGSQYAGVNCVPGACDAAVKRVKEVGGVSRKSRAVTHAGPARSGGGVPKGPPAIASSGWEYDLGGGGGILPRFDVAKKPKPSGGDHVPAEVIVQRAVTRLELPEPVIRTSPDEDFVQVVHVPTWMWVERETWGPVSATAAVDGVKVTATAHPRIAVWSMGEGGSVVCHGPGTPYTDAYGPKAPSPDCGYTYQRASLSAPDKAFTVSVQVTWDVEWHGGGQAGVVPGLVMGAERQLMVDEVQAVVTR